MHEPTEHLGTVHPEEWRTGITCDDCQDHLVEAVQRHDGAKRVGALLYRIAKEREGGYTQRDIERDIITSAKEDGREIQRAGVTWT